MAHAQVAYGNTRVAFDPAAAESFGASKRVSVDDLVVILKEIHKEAKLSGFDPTSAADREGVDRLYRRMWNKYSEFSREMPVIFRWTVQTMRYDVKAFRFYIEHHHRPMWKDRKEMLMAQVEYLVHMFRSKNRRSASAAEVARYRAHVTEMVIKEEESFQEASKEAQEEGDAVAAEQEKLLRARVAELAQLAKAKAEAANSGE